MEQHSHLPPFCVRDSKQKYHLEWMTLVQDKGPTLAQNKEEVEGKVVGNMAVLSIPPAKRHFGHLSLPWAWIPPIPTE